MALFAFLLMQVVVSMGNGEKTCSSPSLTMDTYTTKQVVDSSVTAHIVEFSVNCKEDDIKGILNMIILHLLYSALFPGGPHELHRKPWGGS